MSRIYRFNERATGREFPLQIEDISREEREARREAEYKEGRAARDALWQRQWQKGIGTGDGGLGAASRNG